MICEVCEYELKFPVLLLCCHKQVCSSCYFEQIQSKCPFCDKTVSVRFFCEETDENEKNICEKHNQELIYILDDTKKLICQECLFEKVTSGESNEISELKGKLHKIKTKKDFSEVLNSISNLVTIKKRLLDKLGETNKVISIFNDIKESEEEVLEKGYMEYLKSFQKDYEKQTTKYNEIAEKVDTYIKDATLYVKQAELLLNSTDPSFRNSIKELSGRINKLINDINNDDFQRPSPDFLFPDKIQPPLREYGFFIPNFDRLIKDAENDPKKNGAFYSNPFELWSVQWRVKVLVQQNFSSGDKKSFFTAVFVEVNKGLRKLANFSYNIQIIHPKFPEYPSIVRSYRSHFKDGDSWGWNRMADCSKILNENYLHEPDNSLRIKIGLSPTSYQSAAEIAQNKMRELKKKYKDIKRKARIKGAIPESRSKPPHTLKVVELADLDLVD